MIDYLIVGAGLAFGISFADLALNNKKKVFVLKTILKIHLMYSWRFV